MQETGMDNRSLTARLVGRQNRDYYAGALMMVIGLSAIYAGRDYGVGEFSRMGAGFFPVAIGAMLTLVGFCIVLMRKPPDEMTKESAVAPDEPSRFEWRGWFCIVSSIIAFVVFGKYGGLLPATFAAGTISALGDPHNRIRDVLLLASTLCIVAIVVFWWALRVQFPLLTWG
jgi:hypothetical protein